ncbi:DUF2249 domain-containing protein [Gordonia hydrophobica]|uniref:DUF2249 domain-containing protein n=1 Tax=Gordonia hydrophobica TaxID=40516 RepID=A0ABZ2TX97_9ACTN|nr:DUF2249 domain-containing protein [Gordonia hydrophobica]MBM7366309.1 uncharacterized protein (DUF2249 family) [Gordonia hydrophobica]
MQELPITEAASTCTCEEEHGLPELDASAIPHAIRHGAVIGAFQQVRPGAAMVLVAPHDPKPLLGQLVQIEGDAIEISYVQQGPDAWKIRLGRK